jgi:transcriptional regulator with XRE-family HTH domain
MIRSIVRERKRLKLSRYRLSKLSGVSQQMIGYVEKGERIPSLEITCRLCGGLGLTIEVIRTAE